MGTFAEAFERHNLITLGVYIIGGFLYAIVDHFEQKGYNRAKVEMQGVMNEKIKEATQKAISEAKKEMQLALNRQQSIHDNELARAADEREVKAKTEKVIEYVDKIVIKNQCISVNPSITELYNESIRFSNSASN